MVNPKMDPQWTIPLGESAELIADKHKISREQQDEYALSSHQKAAKAQAEGLFEPELTPVRSAQARATRCSRRRRVRPPGRLSGSDGQTQALLRAENGTVTAGNASPLNDGAAALLLTDEEGLKATGREPLARVSATGVSAIDPQYFGLAPWRPSTGPWPRRARALATCPSWS